MLTLALLCGFWLPVWFYLIVTRSLAGGEPCGSVPGVLGGSGRAAIAFAAKPAGPSTRAKADWQQVPGLRWGNGAGLRARRAGNELRGLWADV